MSAEKQIEMLGRDLHHLGVANSVEISAKLYEMGWRKSPGGAIAMQVQTATLVQQVAAAPMAQLANPNQMIPRAQRWMQ